MTDWKQVIARWRALPERERHRRVILGIPRKVARSMAMEGEPVSVEMLEETIERRSPKLFSAKPGPTVARFALVDPPLPTLEEALHVGEWFRQAVMSQAGRMLGRHGVPPVLSGHDLPTGNRHGHAFYLPEDTNGDGRIDCVTVYLPDGIDQACHRALVRLTRMWNRDGREWRVLLETISDARALAAKSTLFARASCWTSVTPYLHPWHVKKKFTIEDQLRRECRERGLPEVASLERFPSICVNGRERHPIHFHRFRNKRGLVQPDTQGSFWRIRFTEPVQGPLALGFGCHFGLGLFRGAKS